MDRLAQIDGNHPGAPEIGATGSTTYAYQQGAKMAQDMTSLGFNLDLAPDVDVKLVDGRDLLCRTFGSTPGTVTQLAGAYLNGLQQNGVVGTLKHFPGLGDALGDAHLSLPVINRTRDQIESVELAPYRSMINSGQVQMVMTTDLLLPSVDPVLPAELSPSIITGVLRSELGFDGVVMTDALYMQGISDKVEHATGRRHGHPGGRRHVTWPMERRTNERHDLSVEGGAQKWQPHEGAY